VPPRRPPLHRAIERPFDSSAFLANDVHASKSEEDRMRIAILGTGVVGRALGQACITLGHEVTMGSRDARNEKAVAWAKEMGEKAKPGTFADAASFGEIVFLATLGMANESALTAAGAANLRGKVLIDTTNPLGHMSGGPPTLAVSGNDSGGERVQRQQPEALVVKAFNTVGAPHMFRPTFPGGPPDMFIAGNSADAKKKVATLLGDFGWGVVDIGGIEGSRYLEAMCITWVLAGIHGGNWNIAFKLLRK
jgi:predicted dinucleotide-binding enzyme